MQVASWAFRPQALKIMLLCFLGNFLQVILKWAVWRTGYFLIFAKKFVGRSRGRAIVVSLFVFPSSLYSHWKCFSMKSFSCGTICPFGKFNRWGNWSIWWNWRWGRDKGSRGVGGRSGEIIGKKMADKVKKDL